MVNGPQRQNTKSASLFIGCAGWSLPKTEQARFKTTGSHLERYASRFKAVEINSSFYRSHRPATYARWGDSVPTDFRFAVKIPKAITHVMRLENVDEQLMKSFLAEIAPLRDKLGCLLVQLPPSLGFVKEIASRFVGVMRAHTNMVVACEPRHRSWFTDEADSLLQELQVARVAADPALVPAAAEPGGWRGISYYRLHGSPKKYYSEYSDEFIAALRERLRKDLAVSREVWCIFDNTALGAATRNALDLRETDDASETTRSTKQLRNSL